MTSHFPVFKISRLAFALMGFDGWMEHLASFVITCFAEVGIVLFVNRFIPVLAGKIPTFVWLMNVGRKTTKNRYVRYYSYFSKGSILV